MAQRSVERYRDTVDGKCKYPHSDSFSLDQDHEIEDYATRMPGISHSRAVPATISPGPFLCPIGLINTRSYPRISPFMTSLIHAYITLRL